jgi:ABC-type hemin transport system ATPase subunit
VYGPGTPRASARRARKPEISGRRRLRRWRAAPKLLAPIELALGGRVALENGRFYVELPSGKMEAHVVAEGLRKLAMMAQLVINGALLGHTALFWDEPEANMNPKLSQALGRLVFELAAQGVQVFLATHDYMLTSAAFAGEGACRDDV